MKFYWKICLTLLHQLLSITAAKVHSVQSIDNDLSPLSY